MISRSGQVISVRLVAGNYNRKIQRFGFFFTAAQRAWTALRQASLRSLFVIFAARAFPPSRAISVTVIGFFVRFFLATNF